MRILAILTFILLPSISAAATRSFEATVEIGADAEEFLTAIGAPLTTSEITMAWGFDELAPPRRGPESTPSGGGPVERVYLTYSFLTFNVGGVTIAARSPVGDTDGIGITDAPEGAIFVGSPFFLDSFTILSSDPIVLPDGSRILEVFFLALLLDGPTVAADDWFGRHISDPAFSGLDHLSVDDLNRSNSQGLNLFIERSDGSAYRTGGLGGPGSFVETTNLPSVPLPASLPMLLMGLGLPAVWMRRRGRRTKCSLDVGFHIRRFVR